MRIRARHAEARRWISEARQRGGKGERRDGTASSSAKNAAQMLRAPEGSARDGVKGARDSPDAEVFESCKLQTLMDALFEKRADFLAFVAKRVGSLELAEEVLQVAFARAVEKRRTVRADESVVGWFYRVLRNAVTDLERRDRATARALKNLAREIDVHVGSDSELTGEFCRCVVGLLPALKRGYRRAIETVDLHGKSIQELAEREGITANNASVRLHRARHALARRIRAMCGPCAVHGFVDCDCADRNKIVRRAESLRLNR